MIEIKWNKIPEYWKDYLTIELSKKPNGILVIDPFWKKAHYFEDEEEYYKLEEKGWVYGDLFEFEIDNELEKLIKEVE